MELKLNENLIRFRGKHPMEKPLEMGKDVILKIKVNCDEIQKKDRQDGTMDKVFVCGILDVEEDKD